MLRKTLCRLLCCIAILCLTATSVFAKDWFDGPAQNGSISFDFNTEDIQVTGGSVDLRMVARWNDETKALEWCEGWEDCGLTLEENGLFNDKNAAARLFVYAEVNELPARTIQVGEDGTAKVEDLPLGLYLVSQVEPFEGCMTMLPALHPHADQRRVDLRRGGRAQAGAPGPRDHRSLHHGARSRYPSHGPDQLADPAADPGRLLPDPAGCVCTQGQTP